MVVPKKFLREPMRNLTNLHMTGLDGGPCCRCFA